MTSLVSGEIIEEIEWSEFSRREQLPSLLCIYPELLIAGDIEGMRWVSYFFSEEIPICFLSDASRRYIDPWCLLK